jgi:hypothetical protein
MASWPGPAGLHRHGPRAASRPVPPHGSFSPCGRAWPSRPLPTAGPARGPAACAVVRPIQRPARLHIRGAVRVSNPNRLLPNPQRSQGSRRRRRCCCRESGHLLAVPSRRKSSCSRSTLPLAHLTPVVGFRRRSKMVLHRPPTSSL